MKAYTGKELHDMVDSTKVKQHEQPFVGQTWITITDNGRNVRVGRCIGVTLYHDTDGVVVNWKAFIWDGSSQPFSINKSQASWRSAAEWHAAPPEMQVDDTAFRTQVWKAFEEMANAFDEQIKATATRSDVEQLMQTVQELVSANARLEGQVRTLLALAAGSPSDAKPTTPAPLVSEADRPGADPVAGMAPSLPPAAAAAPRRGRGNA